MRIPALVLFLALPLTAASQSRFESFPVGDVQVMRSGDSEDGGFKTFIEAGSDERDMIRVVISCVDDHPSLFFLHEEELMTSYQGTAEFWYRIDGRDLAGPFPLTISNSQREAGDPFAGDRRQKRALATLLLSATDRVLLRARGEYDSHDTVAEFSLDGIEEARSYLECYDESSS